MTNTKAQLCRMKKTLKSIIPVTLFFCTLGKKTHKKEKRKKVTETGFAFFE